MNQLKQFEEIFEKLKASHYARNTDFELATLFTVCFGLLKEQDERIVELEKDLEYLINKFEGTTL